MTTLVDAPIKIVGSKRKRELGQYVLDLCERLGHQITPPEVVDDARRPDSPLHGLFCWDDTEAAREYRLWQARHLLGTIKVRYTCEPDPRRGVTMRAMINVVRDVADGEDGGQVYMRSDLAMNEADLRDQILKRAIREAEFWASKYRNLVELAGIVDAIDRVARRDVSRAARNGRRRQRHQRNRRV